MQNDHTIESDDEEDDKRKDDEYEKLNEEDIEGSKMQKLHALRFYPYFISSGKPFSERTSSI